MAQRELGHHGGRFGRRRLLVELDRQRRSHDLPWDTQSKLLVDATSVLDDAQTGNKAQIIIQRLCAVAGLSAIDPGQSCSDAPVINGGSSHGGGGYPSILPGAAPSPFYRVTTRVTGPRSTVSYTQVLLQ